MKKLIILGCTGSIGTSTIDVVRQYSDRFSIVGLSAHRNREALSILGKEFPGSALCLSGTVDSSLEYSGEQGLLNLVENTEADMVVHGISGAAGLLPAFRAINSGKDLALANKESIVMAGNLLLEQAKNHNRSIIPVDSEHSALFFLLKEKQPDEIAEIIITASGGAFREMPLERLKTVTKADALKHPTWEMGEKITIDSASMANKGLEVIEASRLFSLKAGQIKTVIHPQSYVHSMVKTLEGSIYAQISNPDMRIPIQNALTYPEILPSPYGSLDFSSLEMQFLAPEEQRYPMLFTAFDILSAGNDALPVVYNAANEVAVDCFCRENISFTDISRIVRKTLETAWEASTDTLEEIMYIDTRARTIAQDMVKQICQ